VADLPFDLDARLNEHLAGVLDVEGKIPRALEALGPVGGRDVVLLGRSLGIRARQLTELGARVRLVETSGPATFEAPDQSADALVSLWSGFRGDPGTILDHELAEAARVLRPGGRLLVVHDYGRDDVSTLRGDLAEHIWGRRDGPFLGAAFKIRVLHCWWTFGSLDDARAYLGDAFDAAGRAFGDRLTRPRLSYNVAVYHCTIGEKSHDEHEPVTGSTA
jgi:SAM-dependent methyltransferase